MRRFVCLLVLGVLGTTTVQAGDKDVFFNGKDLTGFEGLIGQFWSVRQGDIVGSTAPDGINFNTFLCSKKKYKDFEMQFQVKLTKSGNSGIQIRSHIHNMEKFAVTGPQCDMGGPFWGSLYGENFGGMMKAADAKLVNQILKEGEFNDYYIKCVGKHVTIKLNGETTVDDDFPKMPEEGIIAFQIHGGSAMEVVFRNIRFEAAGLNPTPTSKDAAIPAGFRGRWTLEYSAPTGGEATIGDRNQLLTVAASKVKVETGLNFLADNELTVEKVVLTKAPPGKTAVLVRFTNGAIWLVGQHPKHDKNIVIMLVKDNKTTHTLMLSPAK